MPDSTARSKIPGWILFLAVLVALSYIRPMDSTDYGRFGRSGLRLHIDSATGCHYVSTIFGGPTPRLDADGQHICGGYSEEMRMERAR